MSALPTRGKIPRVYGIEDGKTRGKDQRIHQVAHGYDDMAHMFHLVFIVAGVCSLDVLVQDLVPIVVNFERVNHAVKHGESSHHCCLHATAVLLPDNHFVSFASTAFFDSNLFVIVVCCYGDVYVPLSFFFVIVSRQIVCFNYFDCIK